MLKPAMTPAIDKAGVGIIDESESQPTENTGDAI